jgi:hypothetical protein
MANTKANFGFKHIGYVGGGAPDYAQTAYRIQSTYTTPIGFGEPVSRENATSAYIIRGNPATAVGPPFVGVFMGCQYTPSGGLGIPQWSPGWPGSSVTGDVTAYVIDSPSALFLVASTNSAIVTADIGKVGNFTTGTPSTVGAMLSTATLEQSSLTSNITATYYPFKVYQLYQGVGNGSDATTPYNWVVVTFNASQLKSLGS